jgi:hypothetical protein
MSETSQANDRPFQRLLLRLIHLYQKVVSPLLPNACRFHPSCSCYAHDAITTHGAFRGAVLALARLLRCHPWSKGGFDPVSPAHEPNTHAPGRLVVASAVTSAAKGRA